MQTQAISEVTREEIQENQTIEQPTTWHGQPTRGLLTVAEQASGCRVYAIRRSCPELHLQAGDLAVAQPVARDVWPTVQDGQYYILNTQMPAWTNPNGCIESAYEAEELIRVVGHAKKRSFCALVEIGNGTTEGAHYRFSTLLDLHRLTRIIRLL